MPVVVVALWSVCYLVLGLVWTFGGSVAYPFDAGDGAGDTLLDPLPVSAGGGVLAALALAAGLLALTIRGRRPGRVAAVAAVAAGICLAVVIPDVRILMTVGYLLVMTAGAVVGQVDIAMVTTMVTWPSINLLIMMSAGVALTVLGARRWLGSPAWQPTVSGALRVGRIATAIAVAVPFGYAVTRFGWLFGIPVGISDEFLAVITEIAPIGAGLAAFGLLGAVLTVGLVRPWGEIWPRWVPLLRGRTIPARLPAFAALAVAMPITSAGLMYVRKKIRGEDMGPAGASDQLGAWLPEMLWPLWGAALAVAAIAYLVRRRLTTPGERPGEPVRPE
ncbi:hypothetical protein BAY61_05390 [Prauserella marina]|uniref:Uncharacterized protein n=2 Tax=Prauserella marina TaxID=530584 RepID=A0A222VKU9_9PSEU|nr:hypothetical protein BAY61_05390 [Prauserella marina]PWV85880.1 hypothetical protein DES30_1011910 [Prauserella marina]SDC43252.1 hypothetical protein SAMN05421630_10282 [Prauserella marina]